MLFVPPGIPFMDPVPEAEALTEAECLSSTAGHLSSSELNYTVITCADPFDVTVSMGQRLHIQINNGGHNMLPSAIFGSPGTYQYTAGGLASGTITLVNPVINDLSVSNPSVVVSGSSHTVTYYIQKQTSGNLESAKIHTLFLDSSGEPITTRYDTLSTDQVNQHGNDFTSQITACCLPNATPVASVAVYIVNVKADHYLSETGTDYAVVPNIYPGSSEITQLTINSLDIYQNTDATDGTANFWWYRVTGNAPASTDLTFDSIRPNGDESGYDQTLTTDGTTYDFSESSPGQWSGLLWATGPPLEKWGTWTLKVCAPEYDMCVEENFTISEPADTTPPIVTVPDDMTVTSNPDGWIEIIFDTDANDDGNTANINTGTYCDENSNAYWEYQGDGWSHPSGFIRTDHRGIFPVGTTVVTCYSTDVYGNTGDASFTITVNPAGPQAQLTMNSPNISEWENFGDWDSGVSIVRYNPTGSFNFDEFHDTNNTSSCLSVQVLKPDGTEASITYDTACVQHFAYNYNFAGFIIDAFNASGWTMKICSTGHNVCVEQNFTISFAFLDDVVIDPTITVPSAPVYVTTNNATEIGMGGVTYYYALGAWGIQEWVEDGIITTDYPGHSWHIGQPSITATDSSGNHIPHIDDNSSAPGHLSCNPTSGAFFSSGTTTVNCTATDADGNTGTASFTVTVVLESGDTTTLEWTSQSFEDNNQNLNAMDIRNNKLYGIKGGSAASIVIFDLATNQMAIIETGDMGDGKLRSSSDIATDNSGSMYVTEAGGNSCDISYGNCRLVKFDSNGDFVWSTNQFSLPANGVAVDNSGNIYVTVYSQQGGEIKKFDSEGTLLTTFGNMPSTNGCFTQVRPTTIEFGPDGNLWVSVGNGCTIPWTGNNWNGVAKIQKYSTSGSLLSSFGESGNYESFTDSAGVYRSDTPGNGEFGQYGAQSITFDGGYMFAADTANSRIQKFTMSGSFSAVYLAAENGEYCNSEGNICYGSGPKYLAADNGKFYVLGIHRADALGDRASILTLSDLESETVSGGDTIQPVVNVPAYISVSTSSSSDGTFTNSTGTYHAVTFNVTASDNVGVTSGPTCTPQAGLFPVGTTTVTCIAMDAVGNVGTASFSVTVTLEETPGPIITVPSDQTHVTNNATEIGMGGSNYYFHYYGH